MGPEDLARWLALPLPWVGSGAALLWAVGAAILVGAAITGGRELLLYGLRGAAQTAEPWDDLIRDLASRLGMPTVVAIALAAGAAFLPLPAEAYRWGRWGFAVVIALQFAVWSGVVSRSIVLALERLLPRHFDADHLSVVRTGIRVALWLLVLVATLDNLGVAVGSLLAGLGIGGISLALAVQRVLGDLISTLTIALDQPFVEGDAIVLGEVQGRVIRVGLKTTRVRALSGEEWVIPNADMVTQRLRNQSRMQERRVTHTLTVPVATPPEALRRIPGALEACCRLPDLRFGHARLVGLADAGFQFELCWFVLEPELELHQRRQEEVLQAVAEVWAREGLAARPAVPAAPAQG